ncbi:MAG: hypothetical protein CFE41_10520 [Burkholderiales bacterium PBB2]|nr:MAG: hypothetical protein CFE41_10520 [Burkholderiales bacterium PBB2]
MTPHSHGPAAEDQNPGRHAHRRLRRKLCGLLLLLALLLGLSLLWSQGSWREQLQADVLLPQLQALGQRLGPLGVIGLMTLALVLAVPLMLMTVLALAALGPAQGMACTLASGVLAAGLSHGIGHWLGHGALQALAGPRLQAISQALAARGLVAVVLIRWLPIAPFALVNMVAGASHIRLQHMLLGTLIGMLPATLALAFFMEALIRAWQSAQLHDVLGLLGGVLLLGLAGSLLRRWVRRRRR